MPRLARILGNFVAAASMRPAWQRYGLAVLLPLLALVLTFLLTSVSRAPFFAPFSLAVVLVSVFAGMKPGFVSVALGVLLNGIVAPPAWSIRVADGDDIVRLTVFAAGGCVIAAFVGASGELEHSLRAERNRLSVMLRSIGDGVIATDPQGRVTMMNPIAEQITGWAMAEAAGQPLENIFRIINETTRATVDNPVRRVLAEGRIVGLANHTLLIRRDGAEIPIDDSAAPIREDDAIVGVILVFRDVSTEKLNQAAMMHAEKLASVGKLASTIAHEINNPLEAVHNLLFLISSDESLSPRSGDYLQMAQNELSRAAEMARNTLSFHKGESAWAAVPIAPLIDAVFTTYRSRASQRSISMHNAVASDVTVFGVGSQLRQLFSNLVTNALDAMPNGGTITVRAGTSQNGSGEMLTLTVEDTGTGIQAGQVNRIFEPFFTTKADVGTGLGLWVAKRIVDDHDGTISVQSQTSGPNRGTAFVIALPLHADTSQATSANI